MFNSIDNIDLFSEDGTKIQAMFKVPNSETHLPITIINGDKKGKTMLITAGIHGCEYVGIQAAIELAKEIESKDIVGRVIIIHPVNVPSFRSITPALVLEDGKNINRMFPGNIEGTISERIAHVITHEFQDKSDFYLDLHGGDQNEMLTPFAFYPGVADEDIIIEAKKIANALNIKYIVKSKATTGAYNSAAIRGIPSLLIERGGRGLWETEEVCDYKNDVLSALYELGFVSEPVYNNTKENPKDVINMNYLESNDEGCWYPEIKAGDMVTTGQKLGEIKDLFGEVIETFYSKVDGVVLYMTSSLSVGKGTPLVAYGEISS